MPRDPVLKPSTLKAAAETARKLHREARTGSRPGDLQLRRDLHIVALTLEWVLRQGRDPVLLVTTDEANRRSAREKVARARAEAVDGL